MSNDIVTRTLTAEDEFGIHSLMARYGHTIDDEAWADFADLFTKDADYDGRAFGMAHLHGRDAIREAFTVWEHPIVHFTTNVVVGEGDATNGVRVRSKWLVLASSSRVIGGEYRDIVAVENGQWRFRTRVGLVAKHPSKR
jgi:3-phenylpropionate/cinnamic acid dioxygenase small subunit